MPLLSFDEESKPRSEKPVYGIENWLSYKFIDMTANLSHIYKRFFKNSFIGIWFTYDTIPLSKMYNSMFLV